MLHAQRVEKQGFQLKDLSASPSLVHGGGTVCNGILSQPGRLQLDKAIHI